MTNANRWAFMYDLLPNTELIEIADIGANSINPMPYKDLLDADLCKVYGFEPQTSAYQKLVREASPREMYFNEAVGPTGPGVLHAYPASGLTSLYPLDPKLLRYLGKFENQIPREKRINVSLTALDDIAGLPNLDLLKIDVQGAEKDIIATGRQKLQSAGAIITEIRFLPIYRDEPTWRELDSELCAQGFMLHKFMHLAKFNINNSRSDQMRTATIRNQVLDGDAVYIPSMVDIEDIEAQRLLKTAILADSVFQSYDLALKCLDELKRRGLINDSQIDAYFEKLMRNPSHEKNGDIT